MKERAAPFRTGDPGKAARGSCERGVEPLPFWVISCINTDFSKNAVLESIKASRLPAHAVALTHDPTGPRGKASLLSFVVAGAGPKNQTYLIDDSPDVCDKAVSFSVRQSKAGFPARKPHEALVWNAAGLWSWL